MRRLLLVLVAFVMIVPSAVSAQSVSEKSLNLPLNINSGPFEGKYGHIQGIAVDAERKYVYYSYTTMLVKTDIEGNVIGSVVGLLGHLGDMDFNPEDGRVYGSLEYKSDGIGKGILQMTQQESLKLDNAFYIAIFDVDRITRMNMDAEKDGIMTTVFLPTVLEDYLAKVEVDNRKVDHRLACSGIDGVAFGPRFGRKGGKLYLTTSYGVYSDTQRSDNDYQVLLQYDVAKWAKYERTLSQERMHQNGPAKPDGQYFVPTGNTTYGVQNLEYDPELAIWWMAVYKGKKSNYPNYLLYAVDALAKPKKESLKGVPYINKASVVPLQSRVESLKDSKSGVTGWNFGFGSTGLASIGDGLYYISHPYTQDKRHASVLKLYKFNGKADGPFELVK